MLTPSRLMPPWRRCAQCGSVHAARICHTCKGMTPAVPVLLDEPVAGDEGVSFQPPSEAGFAAGLTSLPGVAPAAGRVPAAGFSRRRG